MRDDFDRMKPWINESAIANLDSSKGLGTHWVAYRKRGRKVQYYDSFGDLIPPNELLRYFSGNSVEYNFETDQKFNTNVCGHLCLKFLIKAQDKV